MEQAAILAATGLRHAYPGPVRALAGVDFAARAGEFTFVIGPNGSGKSTLLRILAGILAPDAGEVRLEGRSLTELAARERARRIALVPQYLPVLPEVLVADFVLSGRYARVPRWTALGADDRRIAASALADCDAGELACRGMDELSGGQRQRVLVARAVAQEAPVLLVDEPTNALDPEHQIQVLDLLARLTCTDRAVVVVSHDLNLASQYATRLVLLDEGRVVKDGAPEDVLTRAVLEPVYGAQLHYGSWDVAGRAARPYVLPRRGS
ncbi:MAG: ABC transporter ATP-binding protein [Planctomycetota bacterium]|nr:ABC transporter ATP-binding protein [Planctomycetota bacterium]